MSFGGSHALLTAADDPLVAAVVSLVPVADGVASNLRPAPPGVVARGLRCAVREVLTRRPVTVLIPMDHFGCFSPGHVDHEATDEVAFLLRHL